MACLLQQGYECTRRFLTEFISSSAPDNGNPPPENQCNNCRTATCNEHCSQNSIQNSCNHTVCDNVPAELGKMSTSYHELNSSLGTSSFVDCLSASADSMPWCAATQQLEVSRVGLDSSYSEASVLETQVWRHSIACQYRLCCSGCDHTAQQCTLPCLAMYFDGSLPTIVESCFLKMCKDSLYLYNVMSCSMVCVHMCQCSPYVWMSQ